MRKLAEFFALILWLVATSCQKELSFEGGNANPSGPPVVVPSVPADEIPVCPFCKTLTTTDLSTWSFKVGNTIACGQTDTAIVTFDRRAFTFFGPSSCSRDTGLVITWYLKDSLNKDMTNVAADGVSFFYYDRVTPSYIFMSQANSSFWGILESYNNQTKIATGIFAGLAFRTNGIGANISSGRFKVKLL